MKEKNNLEIKINKDYSHYGYKFKILGIYDKIIFYIDRYNTQNKNVKFEIYNFENLELIREFPNKFLYVSKTFIIRTKIFISEPQELIIYDFEKDLIIDKIQNMNKNKNSMLYPYLYCGNIQVDNYENVYLYKIYEREKIIQNCSTLKKNICLLEEYIKNTKKEINKIQNDKFIELENMNNQILEKQNDKLIELEVDLEKIIYKYANINDRFSNLNNHIKKIEDKFEKIYNKELIDATCKIEKSLTKKISEISKKFQKEIEIEKEKVNKKIMNKDLYSCISLVIGITFLFYHTFN